jgi:signal transduction histidine kinase
MPDFPFLIGGGEMGALIRAHDWRGTTLGTPAQWPQSLRIAVRLMLNSRHPMYIFWGKEGNCLYNDAYRQSIGAERHPSSLGPQVDQVMNCGAATWHENQLVPITRDGVREDVYWTYGYSPIDDESTLSGVGGVLVVCTETTLQVKSEQRLAAESERQRRALQQMPGFVGVLVGPRHIYEYVNDAYIEISGPRDFIGRSVRDVFPELEGQDFFELLDRVYASGLPFVAQAMPIKLSNRVEPCFIDFVYHPILDQSGAATGIFVGGYDVTELVRAKTEVEQVNASLEQRVADALHERGSIEAVLRQAQKMEAVGQLSGGLAHDFNNLLSGINGSRESMQTRIARGDFNSIDRDVSRAQQASKRAAALTHRLLAFSRQQTLDPKRTDIGRLVAGMEDLMRRTVGPSVRIEVVEADALWTALIDPNQLENAVLNLCINARDATPAGGLIKLEIFNQCLDSQAAAEIELAAGEYLAFCVSDTGRGMTAEVAARAFDPFFTTKPMGEGAGLGLSMVYGFVRQSGGQIRIFSEINQGTRISFYLPRHLDAAD